MVAGFQAPGENTGTLAFHKWQFLTSKFHPVNPARVVRCPNAVWPHLRANGCCALFPVPWQHGPCSQAGVIGTGCSSGQAGGTVQLAPRRGGQERVGRGCPGAALRGSNSPGSCPLLSSCSNLEAQRPHLSESCSIGKPACLQSSACVQSLSSACSYAIVKDSLKVTEKQTSPVTSQ